MDSDYCVKVDEEGKYDRRTYTAHINSAVNPVNNMKRTYTTMDNFPTTLAAMGVKHRRKQIRTLERIYFQKS